MAKQQVCCVYTYKVKKKTLQEKTLQENFGQEETFSGILAEYIEKRVRDSCTCPSGGGFTGIGQIRKT